MSNPNGLFAKLQAMPNESPQKMLLFTVTLCFVCALMVSSSRVLLRPYQEYNKEVERSRNILQAAGLLKSDTNILDTFKTRVTPKLVDLKSGEYAEDMNPATYDQRKAAKDPKLSTALTAKEDIAGIKRRANYAPVYLVKNGEQVETIVIPVHGYGLWSTMYGFLALKNDARTVLGITFYEHGETPGLGAEITNPLWLAKWVNKVMYGNDGKIAVQIVKGRVDPTQPGSQHQIDAIAGATLTTRGVENLMRYWLGEQGFGTFLTKLQKG